MRTTASVLLLATQLALATVLSACGPGEQPVDEAPLAVRVAALRSQTGGEGDLWPGFSPDSVPLMVYADGATWLFGHPEPPEGFETVPAREAGEITSAARFPGQHPAAARTGIVELGPGPTVVIVPSAPAVDAAELAALALALSFRVHAAAMGWRVDETGFLTPLYLDAEPLALRRLETEALRRALEAPERLDAIAWARHAMELRARRHELILPALVSTERSLELVEGTAERIARLGAQTLRRKARVADSPPPWAGLLPAEGFPLEAVRERSRAIGAATALLLDRLEPSWPSLAAGALPDRLLAAAKATGEPARLTKDLIGRERARAEAETQARRRELAARYEAAIGRSGWRIVVETQEGRPLQLVDPNPARLVAIDSVTILHKGGLRLRNEQADVIVDREAVTGGVAGTSPPGRVGAAFVAGIVVEPQVATERPGNFTVTAEGFRGTFTDSHVEKEGTNLHVVVPARPVRR